MKLRFVRAMFLTRNIKSGILPVWGPAGAPPGDPPGGLSKAYFARYGVLAFFFVSEGREKRPKTRGRALVLTLFRFCHFWVLAIFGVFRYFGAFSISRAWL